MDTNTRPVSQLHTFQDTRETGRLRERRGGGDHSDSTERDHIFIGTLICADALQHVLAEVYLV